MLSHKGKPHCEYEPPNLNWGWLALALVITGFLALVFWVKQWGK